MKIASVAEVKSQLSALLRASEEGPVVVTRNGRPVAVILGFQDEEEVERLLMAYSPGLRAILERSRHRPQPGLCKGMITIVADDDEHLKDFAEYMP
jgi:prevent-host-death family protein